jgi:hypothetical protein
VGRYSKIKKIDIKRTDLVHPEENPAGYVTFVTFVIEVFGKLIPLAVVIGGLAWYSGGRRE